MYLRLPLAAGSLAIALLLSACSSNEPQSGAAKSTPAADSASVAMSTPAETAAPSNSATATTEPAGQSAPAGQPALATQSAPAIPPVEAQNPNLIRFTAVDIAGNTRNSSEWMGKQPVVINFWGTWCPPCRKEIPDLVKVYNEYKSKGVEIVSLALNDTPEKVKNYAQEARMDWVMLMGDQELSQTFGGIRGVPTTIFFDRTGKEVGRFVGGRDYETFKQAFELIAGS